MEGGVPALELDGCSGQDLGDLLEAPVGLVGLAGAHGGHLALPLDLGLAGAQVHLHGGVPVRIWALEVRCCIWHDGQHRELAGPTLVQHWFCPLGGHAVPEQAGLGHALLLEVAGQGLHQPARDDLVLPGAGLAPDLVVLPEGMILVI